MTCAPFQTQNVDSPHVCATFSLAKSPQVVYQSAQTLTEKNTNQDSRFKKRGPSSSPQWKFQGKYGLPHTLFLESIGQIRMYVTGLKLSYK